MSGCPPVTGGSRRSGAAVPRDPPRCLRNDFPDLQLTSDGDSKMMPLGRRKGGATGDQYSGTHCRRRISHCRRGVRLELVFPRGSSSVPAESLPSSFGCPACAKVLRSVSRHNHGDTRVVSALWGIWLRPVEVQWDGAAEPRQTERRRRTRSFCRRFHLVATGSAPGTRDPHRLLPLRPGCERRVPPRRTSVGPGHECPSRSSGIAFRESL